MRRGLHEGRSRHASCGDLPESGKEREEKCLKKKLHSTFIYSYLAFDFAHFHGVMHSMFFFVSGWTYGILIYRGLFKIQL